jgi:ribokinase
MSSLECLLTQLTVLHKGANYHLPSPPTEPNLKGYTHLLLQNEIPLDDTIAHLRAAGQADLTTLFNPSPMLTKDQLRVFPWSDVSWLIVNEGEIQDLLHAFGISSSSNPATQSPGAQDRVNEDKVVDDFKALANSELFRGKVRIVCTLGAQGLMWATDGQASDVSRKGAGKLKNPVKDTTGAGDCFLGYLTAGLMRGESVEQALDTCLAVCQLRG